MMLSGSIHAYDVLDRVQITVRVWQQGADLGGTTGLLLQASTDIPGVGETEAREWIRDALVGLLEAI